jgi:hypothetical protein
MNATPFSDSDWDGWSGAEGWSTDQPPLIRDLNFDRLAIADRRAVQYVMLGDEGTREFFLPLAMTPALAEAFLNSGVLDGDLTAGDLKALGFTEI